MAIHANRVCRLLAKTTTANELGGNVCWFLTVIVMTEDARRYAGPVTFYNHQLAPLVGCSSIDALERVRKRAVDSGWLEYRPGFNRRPAAYRVRIPQQFLSTDDGPSDEGSPQPALFDDQEDAPNVRESAELDPANIRKNAEVKTAPNVRKNAAVTAPYTTAVPAEPSTYPVPSSKKKNPPTPQGGEDEVFCAIEEVCGVDASVASVRRTLTRKARELHGAKPPYTADEVREFGRRFWELCPHAKDKRERPTPTECAKWIGLLRTKKKKEAGRRATVLFAPVEPTGPSLKELGLDLKTLTNMDSKERKRVMDAAREAYDRKHTTTPPEKRKHG